MERSFSPSDYHSSSSLSALDGSSSQSYSPCSSSSTVAAKKVPKKFDVFLNFRGRDTRDTFTAHLHATLCRAGIDTFIDNIKLHKGRPVPKELLQAIEDSSCSVIIFSENYASSRWCLDELLKIVECMETMDQIVLPIFYRVDPCDVRYQRGAYGKAFMKHERVCRSRSRVQRWKNSLTKVANLFGWHLKKHRNEAEFIKKFVQYVSKNTIPPFPYTLNESEYISKGLFGIERRIKDLSSKVWIEHGGVHMIGICGMGGIGKTSIARAYYDIMSPKFEAASFLSNVGEVYQKEYNPICLQKQLLSQTQTEEKCNNLIYSTYEGSSLLKKRLRFKRVLLVLDGVDQLKQLEELAGSREWFGLGSRILITTRDETLLDQHGITIMYKVEPLSRKESLQLFSFHAFEQPHDPSSTRECTDLCSEVLSYANGLPLALRVLGKLFCGKNGTIESGSYWRSELDRLKEYPSKEIIDVLQIGFDQGLQETEKKIFLDIACFFKGQKKDFVTRVMNCCGFYAESGIITLVSKSLLTIRDDEIWMHDLLQDMGRDIVKRKSRKEPGAWSRLWSYEDFCHVFANNSGTENVEAICINFPSSRAKSGLSLEAFLKMKFIRLLCITGGSSANVLSSQPREWHCSEYLRFLKWEGYPLKSLPSSFRPNDLVELHMESSSLVELFDQKIKPLENLKIINLSHSKSLIQIQHLQDVVPNLEKLILSFCTELTKIDESITFLRRLTLLDLECCERLEFLQGNLKFLRVLNLRYCCYLPPNIELSVKWLEELNMSKISSKKVVSWSFGGKGLFSSCLSFLKRLDLSGCNLLDESFPPESFCYMSSLDYLDLSRNYFERLPQGVSRLLKLRYLHVDECHNLRWLGELPSSLELLTAIDCFYLQDSIFITQSSLRCSALLIDCHSLVDECMGMEAMLLTSLKRHVQNSTSTSERFDIVIPGKNIPEWFTHRNKRWSGSVFMDLNPNWCNSKWMGFVLCLMYDAGGNGGLVGFEGTVKINGQDWGLGPINIPHLHFVTTVNSTDEDYFGTYFLSAEQVWLMYLPRTIYFQPKWQLDENSCRIEFEFPGHSIINCGARLLCEEDIKELELQPRGWSS